jgi:hypothetical protein
MNRVVMCPALAGMAFGASGQNISTDLVVSLTFDKTIIDIGETATATITASWNGVTGSYFSSFNIDLLVNTPAIEVVSVDPIAWNNPALGFTGEPASIEGGNIIGLQASQFSLIPPFVNTNPILVTTFTVVGVGPYTVLQYSAQAAAGAPFPFSVTGPIFSDPVVEFGLDSFQSSAMVVLPSPGAAGMLAIGGLVGLRRRR